MANPKKRAEAVLAPQKTINYQFTAIPTKLFYMCDTNCRNMLFVLIQLSDKYSDNEGWFERANLTLRTDTGFSENLVRATVDSLYRHGIVEVICNNKTSNRYRLNIDKFGEFEKYSMDEIRNNSELKITQTKYKNNFTPSYLTQQSGKELCKQNCKKVRTYIDNIENKKNINNITVNNSIHENIEKRPNEFKDTDDDYTDLLNSDVYEGELDEWQERLIDETVEVYMDTKDLDTSNSNVEDKNTNMPIPTIGNDTDSNYGVNTALNSLNQIHGDYRQFNEQFNKIYEDLRRYREEWKQTHSFDADSNIIDNLKSAVEMHRDGKLTAKQINGYFRFIMGYFKMRVKYNRKLIFSNNTLKEWFWEALHDYFNSTLTEEEYLFTYIEQKTNNLTELNAKGEKSLSAFAAYATEIASLHLMKYEYADTSISQTYRQLIMDTYGFQSSITSPLSPTGKQSVFSNNNINHQPQTAPEAQNKAVVTPSTTSNEEMSTFRPKDVTEGESAIMEELKLKAKDIINQCRKNCLLVKTDNQIYNASEISAILNPIVELIESVPTVEVLEYINNQATGLMNRLYSNPTFHFKTLTSIYENLKYTYEVRHSQLTDPKFTVDIESCYDKINSIKVYPYLSEKEIKANLKTVEKFTEFANNTNYILSQDDIKAIDTYLWEIENTNTSIDEDLVDEINETTTKWKQLKKKFGM